MHIYWFFPRRLAIRFVQGLVLPQEIAYLMLANLLFGSVIFYGAFTWANEAWTLLSFYEFVTVVAITVIGMQKCYEAAGGDRNVQFAAEFNCLSFPVWFWSTAIVWSVYWAVKWLFSAGIFFAYRFDHLGLAKNLALIGGSFDWLWTFLATIMWQIIFFWWLKSTLHTLENNRLAEKRS